MEDTLSIGKQVDIARIKAGKTQTQLVNGLKDMGVKINSSMFSLKKKYSGFDKEEIAAINKILKSSIKA